MKRNQIKGIYVNMKSIEKMERNQDITPPSPQFRSPLLRQDRWMGLHVS